MAENKIIGYKRIFGFVLPDWVSEKMIKYAIAGLVSSAVMMFVLIFVVRPNFETVTKRNAQLEKNSQELEVLKSSSQGLERLKTDLTATNQEKILAAMPEQYSPDGAIYLLRRISADTGVSIVSYSLPPGSLLLSSPIVGGVGGGEMVGFTIYPIKITVAAPVDSLLVFISKIESSLPFGVVSDLNLQEVIRLSRSAADNTVQLAVEIRFFQTVLKTININKLQPLTAENLNLARELAGYNLLTVPEVVDSADSPQASGSGSIFGF